MYQLSQYKHLVFHCHFALTFLVLTSCGGAAEPEQREEAREAVEEAVGEAIVEAILTPEGPEPQEPSEKEEEAPEASLPTGQVREESPSGSCNFGAAPATEQLVNFLVLVAPLGLIAAYKRWQRR